MLLLAMRGDNNQIVKQHRVVGVVVVVVAVAAIPKVVLSVQSFWPVSEHFNVFTFRDQNLPTNFVGVPRSLAPIRQDVHEDDVQQ